LPLPSICSNVCVLQGYGTTRKDMADRPKFSVTVTLWMAFHHGKWTEKLLCGNESKDKILHQKKKAYTCKLTSVCWREPNFVGISSNMLCSRFLAAAGALRIACWGGSTGALGSCASAITGCLLSRGSDARLLPHNGDLPPCAEDEERRRAELEHLLTVRRCEWEQGSGGLPC